MDNYIFHPLSAKLKIRTSLVNRSLSYSGSWFEPKLVPITKLTGDSVARKLDNTWRELSDHLIL